MQAYSLQKYRLMDSIPFLPVALTMVGMALAGWMQL